MSARALLVELEAAGVRLWLVGNDLHFQTRPGVAIAPYRDTITAHKPALMALLRARDPVEATRSPEQWGGVAPTGCGAPVACRVLGPCRHFADRGRCWKDAGP